MLLRHSWLQSKEVIRIAIILKSNLIKFRLDYSYVTLLEYLNRFDDLLKERYSSCHQSIIYRLMSTDSIVMDLYEPFSNDSGQSFEEILQLINDKKAKRSTIKCIVEGENWYHGLELGIYQTIIPHIDISLLAGKPNKWWCPRDDELLTHLMLNSSLASIALTTKKKQLYGDLISLYIWNKIKRSRYLHEKYWDINCYYDIPPLSGLIQDAYDALRSLEPHRVISESESKKTILKIDFLLLEQWGESRLNEYLGKLGMTRSLSE